jgi:hypothetical protein
MYLVDFGEALGRTMTGYKQRFFESDYMGYKFTPRDGRKRRSTISCPRTLFT